MGWRLIATTCQLEQRRSPCVLCPEPREIGHVTDMRRTLPLETRLYGCFVPRLYYERNPLTFHRGLGERTPNDFVLKWVQNPDSVSASSLRRQPDSQTSGDGAWFPEPPIPYRRAASMPAQEQEPAPVVCDTALLSRWRTRTRLSPHHCRQCLARARPRPSSKFRRCSST
jgi:hypothetical protein